jgi:predicted RNase H-like nuclease
MQSERLAGTGSLLTATEKDMDPTLKANKQAKTNNWVFPMLAIGAVLIGIGAVKI